jgi:hypothetical protein
MGRAYCATATSLGIACLLLCQSSRAQVTFDVTFTAGPEIDVAAQPTYITAADFDGDGIQDVAVSSTGKPVVSVLFGSQAGFQLSGPGLSVGRSLRGITNGDFNGDGIIDIAVADNTAAAALVLPGNGNRQFGAPLSYSTGNRPVDIATGYLDCGEGSGSDCAAIDLVTANGSANSLSLLFNQGGNQGFRSQPPLVLTGRGLTVVKTADFNGDGVDDIALLATSGAGADSTLVLLNNGNGAFASIVPAPYRVGVAATALTIGNFHNGTKTDPVRDIAVLNSGDGNTLPSIFVLLNDGTGLFPQAVETTIKCPSSPCTARDMVTADFNRDSFADLVVSFSTSGNAGFVQIYAGSGNAQFVPALKNPVSIGAPRQIAAGDFTGHNDGLEDIAVTEYTSNKVLLVRAVPPPTPTVTRTPTATRTPTQSQTPTMTFTPTPVPNGEPCSANAQCEQGDYCVDGVCCRDSTLSCTHDTFICSCPAGQICNYSFSLGSCHMRGDLGTPCQKDDDCTSDYCSPNTPRKCAIVPTPTPTPTPTPLGPGDPCDPSSPRCRSGLVCNNNNVCCATDCPAGWSCDDSGCIGPTATGTPTVTATPTATATSTPCGFINCPCQKNLDCEQGLVCNPDTGLCDLPPPATPTLPPVTPTPQCGPNQVVINGACADVSTSRSGGCSIGDPSAEGTSAVAWLLALLPLAFGIRRLGRQGVRAPLHRRARGQ